MTAAFQGERGAFSEEAAYKLLGPRVKPLACPTFPEAFRAVTRGRAEAALIPIENTLAGSVHENYDLLQENRLTIHAEVHLRIVHHLIASPGTRLADVRKVYSHPVALAQCSRFFKRHPRVEKVPFYDTAGSVKMLAADRPIRAAAIASRVAAEVYGARILLSHLEDHRENYTRFLLLKRAAGTPKGADKTSIVFSTANLPGALLKCLSVFSLRDINLTKIESRPLRGRPWEYCFYLDFIGNVGERRCRDALRGLAEVTEDLRVLGCYPSARG